ncbi:putative methyltransferase-domain-containing protein [Pilobolus umbonatus]|nr:putative methyltransferase-domain-containing protein [Pilobolus umbonatus]
MPPNITTVATVVASTNTVNTTSKTASSHKDINITANTAANTPGIIDFYRDNSVHPQSDNPLNINSTDNSDVFKQELYKNNRIYRIILDKPPMNKHIQVDKWYRVELRLVTEMGLPAITDCSSKYDMPWYCQLLEKIRSEDGYQYFSLSKHYQIECRPLPLDSWTERCYQSTIPFTVDDRCYNHNGMMILQELWKNGIPGKLWDSALVFHYLLCDLLNDKENGLNGMNILDLSAGIGLIGISIAKLTHKSTNPPTIIMTDLPEALPLIKNNQLLNNIPESSRFLIESLHWGSDEEAHNLMDRYDFDCIFISDVLYNAGDFPILISTLRLLCSNKKTTAYLGYKPRGLSIEEEESFFFACSQYFDIIQLTIETFKMSLSDSPVENRYGGDNALLNMTGVQLYRLISK